MLLLTRLSLFYDFQDLAQVSPTVGEYSHK